ncbi:MAG: ribosome small subunit-dependent GTPase A [bacterium]|nr:ribosome small subunit-dependent GTPase A [bacterium]
MKKRTRKKPPRRSHQRQDRQQRQMLSKKVRELYPPGSATEEADADRADADDWGSEFEHDPSSSSRPAGLRGEPPAGEPQPPTPPTAAPARGGVVVALSSGACRIDSDGELIECVLPSRLAHAQRAAVAVGDEATFQRHGASGHRLREVLPRRTTLSRPDPHNPRIERLIAANIDVVVQVVSVLAPPLRPALVDRCLIAIERGGAEAVICVNKIDLLPGDGERRRELAALRIYRDMGLRILVCSARTGEGIPGLREILTGRTAVFVGHSGVGKSSLLNALDPRLRASTGELGPSSARGRHTTARSNLYRLADGIRLIDTPGIREFGLWELDADQLRSYFSDFEEPAVDCRFNNCTHTHEPECAVRAAVASGQIDAARHATYRRIYESLMSDSRE